MDVLVASMNVFRLELSAFVLTEGGFDVRECCNNSTLLQEIARQPPHVLLVDQQMLQAPEGDLVHALAQKHNISLLLLVAKPSRDPFASAITNGHVTWPYQQADLVARVRSLCTQVTDSVA